MTGFYRRLIYVVVRLLPFAIAFLRDHRRFILFGSPRRVSETAHEQRAERLTQTLLELGAAFIKAGQVLSTRPDIVPPLYADALASLQDEVPEDSSADPTTIIEEDVDATVTDLQPVAGGSLAFVYTATVRDEEVALKVRRPGLKAQIRRDLQVIRTLVPLVGFVAEERHQYSLRNIADDFERIIFDELDFEREAEMMRRIGSNLAEDDRVYVPSADLELSTERVLVMEYVEGRKITDPEAFERTDVDRVELAERIADVYLRMGLDHGVFHADPHPGNLALLDDGTLVIYDFGMSEQLSAETQQQIIGLYRSLARRDVDGLIDAFIALDVLDPTADRSKVRRVLQLAMENLQGRSCVGWREITTELFDMLHDFPFRIPPNVMLLIRVGTVAEGVCRTLDPEFDFIEVVRTFLLEEGLFERELETLLRELYVDLWASAPALARLPARTDRVLDRLEQGELRVRTDPPSRDSARPLGYVVLAGSFVVAAAILTFHDLPYEIVAIIAAIICLLAFRLTS